VEVGRAGGEDEAVRGEDGHLLVVCVVVFIGAVVAYEHDVDVRVQLGVAGVKRRGGCVTGPIVRIFVFCSRDGSFDLGLSHR
jgi:hypothetical protein